MSIILAPQKRVWPYSREKELLLLRSLHDGIFRSRGPSQQGRSGVDFRVFAVEVQGFYKLVQILLYFGIDIAVVKIDRR